MYIPRVNISYVNSRFYAFVMMVVRGLRRRLNAASKVPLPTCHSKGRELCSYPEVERQSAPFDSSFPSDGGPFKLMFSRLVVAKLSTT